MRGKKVTQKSLGQEIGVAQSAVFGWLHGVFPRAKQLCRLAGFFGVSIEWLANGVDRGSAAPAGIGLDVGRLRGLASGLGKSLAELREILESCGVEKSEIKLLTRVPSSERMPGVKFEMESLLDQARRLTQPRGQKAALAAALSVSPSRVSEWLSGTCEPDGRKTLLLISWVWQQLYREQRGTASAEPEAHPQKPHENKSQGS